MDIKIRKILLPVDFSEHSHKALAYACDLAKKYDARITLLHVFQVPGFVYPDAFVPAGPETYAELMRGIEVAMLGWTKEAERNGVVGVEKKTSEGVPFVEIVGEARAGNYDLVVMGTHGRTGVRHVFMGSVAENVLRRAGCPVLTVRSFDSQEDQADASSVGKRR